MMNETTSWGESAKWYDELLEKEGTYQKDLILPNLLRLMEIKEDEVILDLGCGQGFFSREFSKLTKKIIGSDISKELIAIAKNKSDKIEYHITEADKLSFLEDKSIDKIALVLAIQNMENIASVFKECSRVLKNNGKLYLVLNHPSFRIPKKSFWGWDEENKVQYRRIDSYISESKERIQMHPGDKPSEITLSFHRPLQTYFKALNKNKLAVLRLEEWNSEKKSELGPRQRAEDRARKEIPIFMAIEAVKLS